jgi:hypothetical protein
VAGRAWSGASECRVRGHDCAGSGRRSSHVVDGFCISVAVVAAMAVAGAVAAALSPWATAAALDGGAGSIGAPLP